MGRLVSATVFEWTGLFIGHFDLLDFSIAFGVDIRFAVETHFGVDSLRLCMIVYPLPSKTAGYLRHTVLNSEGTYA